MYSITSKIPKNDRIKNIELSGILFGVLNKNYKIGEICVFNLKIYDQDLAYPIAYKQVEKKFNKLMNLLPNLLINDDDSGESVRETLNQIEKFR